MRSLDRWADTESASHRQAARRPLDEISTGSGSRHAGEAQLLGRGERMKSEHSEIRISASPSGAPMRPPDAWPKNSPARSWKLP